MIELFTGTPGSGKSYNAVRRVFMALWSGKFVIANFALKFTDKQIKKEYDKRFFYWTNEKITIENLVLFCLDNGLIEKEKENQCLVVIDEAGGRFNCREFAKSDRAEWIDFFSQHRKTGLTFILVAQNDRMIDRQIRGLVETEWKHRQVNRFGPFWVLPWTCFVAIEHWYTAKTRVSSEFFFFRKKYGEAYDHMAMFRGFKLSDALMSRIEEQREALNSPGFNVPITAVFNKSSEE